MLTVHAFFRAKLQGGFAHFVNSEGRFPPIPNSIWNCVRRTVLVAFCENCGWKSEIVKCSKDSRGKISGKKRVVQIFTTRRVNFDNEVAPSWGLII